jgi:hypothetical protein
MLFQKIYMLSLGYYIAGAMVNLVINYLYFFTLFTIFFLFILDSRIFRKFL